MSTDGDDTKTSEEQGTTQTGTILNMLNTLLGAGILGICNTFSKCGLVLTLVVMVTVVLLTNVSCWIIIQLADKTESDELGQIASKIIGRRAGITLSILVSIFCLFSMSAFLVVATDTIKAFTGIITSNFAKKALLVTFVALAVPVPLTIPRDISAFYSISTLCVVFIVIFIVVMIYEAAYYLPTHGISKTISIWSFSSGTFSAFSVHCMAFALPIVVLPLLGNYSKEIPKRESLVTKTLFICFILVVTPGILGYLLFGDDCAEDILNSFDNSDVPISVCRILFFFIVSFSYPIVNHCLISSLANIIFTTEDITRVKRYLLLFISNVIPILIASILPNIEPALSIGGAIGGCLVDFFYPAMLWIVQSPAKWYSISNTPFLIIALFGLITAIVAIARAIKDLISGSSI